MRAAAEAVCGSPACVGGLGERRDAAPARVLAEEDHAAVVQCLLPGFGKRHLGIRPEPDRGEPPFDSDALTPRLRDPARRRPVDPKTQAPPAAPVTVHAGSANGAHESGGERSRSLDAGRGVIKTAAYIPLILRTLAVLDAAPEANRDTTVRSGASLRRQCLWSPFRWYGFWAPDGAHSGTDVTLTLL